MRSNEAHGGVLKSPCLAPFGASDRVVQARDVRAERLPSGSHTVRDLEASAVKQAHLFTERLDLRVRQNLGQKVVEGLLAVEDDPLVLVAIGEDLAVLGEHGSEEACVTRATQTMDPFVDAIVVLSKVNVGTVARALRDHVVIVFEHEQVHRVGGHVRADLAHLHDLTAITVGIPRGGHYRRNGGLGHAGVFTPARRKGP